ncbi:putative late blight resistance proteinR1B-23 [Sesamum alatum]|uniref:Late blight resistance proteinR1B-23 n=1 Tax=Sesamum alatum TaxID=300844 RepID=A0AAE2CLX7_9LAMI|nr:putative late blight resistance proteinR1B-23 [Sesamum alatum]
MDLLENPRLPHMLRRLNTKDFKKFDTFIWNGSQMSAVVRYLRRSFSIDGSSVDLLEGLEASRNTSRFPSKVLSFTRKLRDFFRGPIVDYSFNYRTSELLASFLDFLLDTVEEVVRSHPNLIDTVEDQIEILQKELKFLIFVLGDALFSCPEIMETKNFLKQMEDLAEEAGSFMYLYFFTDEGKQSPIKLPLLKLLKRFKSMEMKIRGHCLMVSKIPSFVVPSTAGDSLFIVNSLVNDLKDLLNRDDDVIADLWEEVAALQKELLVLRSFLDVFKDQQHAALVISTRDVSYEAEYIINSFVAGDVPVWYLALRLPLLIQKIKFIGIGLERIRKNYDDVKYLISSFMVGDVPVWYLKLKAPDFLNVIGTGLEEIKSKEPQKDPNEEMAAQGKKTTDDIFVGFEDAERIIDEQLAGGSKQRQVISIFGMPGLGKTTLAKKLYKNQAVHHRFDKCAWGVVSETYQRRSLLADILDSVSDLDRDKILSMDAESLGVELHKSLKKRRYLVVMDDVWAPVVWDDIGRFLPDDGNGSRILITSRFRGVAPPDSIPHDLPFLSDDHCWDLLKQKVFQNRDCPQELLDVGRQIAAHCQGLPLAVVVVAAVLANMEEKKSLWNEVARSLSLQISKDPNKCMNILELSYKHLPVHLKPCFLYFGAFPEDNEISVGKLISLWAAEGFIQEEEGKSLRNVGEEYLMDLINRSLVIVAKRRSGGGVKACTIHDLLRELCLRKAKEENFLNLIKDQFPVYEKQHRLCIPLESVNVESRPFGLHIRSWLGCWSDISCIYSRLKLLRVLDLSIEAKDLPPTDDLDLTGTEQLVHLRYLAARVTADHIPPSINRLQNLEFLLFDAPRSIEIPEALLDLMKLRHLHIRDHATFSESCHRRAVLQKDFQMNRLESVSNLWLIDENNEKILRCFPCLRSLKCATRPLWDSSDKSHRYPVLDHLPLLESLNITYLGSEFKFSDTIYFPTGLKKLTLHKFKLSWKEMSMIGRLLKLEVLKLMYIAFDGKEWKTNSDEFEELKFLKLSGLKLHRWNTSSDHFPKLQRLVVQRCWKLKRFPSSLGDIPTLQIIDIDSCSKSMADSALQVQKKQEEDGNDELKVIISGSCW